MSVPEEFVTGLEETVMSKNEELNEMCELTGQTICKLKLMAYFLAAVLKDFSFSSHAF